MYFYIQWYEMTELVKCMFNMHVFCYTMVSARGRGSDRVLESKFILQFSIEGYWQSASLVSCSRGEESYNATHYQVFSGFKDLFLSRFRKGRGVVTMVPEVGVGAV